MKKRPPRLCLVSSSGGHWEQLVKLKPLVEKYSGFFVTERTGYPSGAKYRMFQTDLRDRWMPVKMAANLCLAVRIFLIERPDYCITTGTMVAYPFYLLACLFRKRFVFIESFNNAYCKTEAARKMEKRADLMIVQWKSMVALFDHAEYGGSLY